MGKRFISILLCFILLLGIMNSCTKEADNESLIKERISTFMSAYSNENFEELLTCVDSEARRTYEENAKEDPVVMSYAQYRIGSIDFRDFFGFSRRTIDVDDTLTGFQILKVKLENKFDATASVELVYKLPIVGEIKEYLDFIMIKEEEEWLISNIKEGQAPTQTETTTFSTESKTEDTHTTETQQKKQSINPFQGLSFTVSGISPLCTVALNTSGCTSAVQQYVTFELDKTYYANGDRITVSASLNNSWKSEQYTLSQYAKEYQLSGQPAYATSSSQLDWEKLEEELNDAMTANIAAAISHKCYGNSKLLGYGAYGVVSVDSTTAGNVYLSVLKSNKITAKKDYYNSLSFTYTVKWTNGNDDQQYTFYSCIKAVNLIVYPDGTLKWGTDTADDLDFIMSSAEGSMENCVTTQIMPYTADYNISQVQRTS